MSEQAPGKRAGRVMLILAWGIAMLLATHFFGRWEDAQRNPNQVPESRRGDGYVEVRLASSRQGHYLMNGRIDGRQVTFLLDTGATAVAVPDALADELGLVPGEPITLSTANGRSNGHRTRLRELQLGRSSRRRARDHRARHGWRRGAARHERPQTTRIHPARRHPGAAPTHVTVRHA